jgi:hypothetical protein
MPLLLAVVVTLAALALLVVALFAIGMLAIAVADAWRRRPP